MSGQAASLKRIAEILNRRGIKIPNEGLAEAQCHTMVNIILGGLRERMQEITFGKQTVDFDKDKEPAPNIWPSIIRI